jgi:hypothetical protein
MDNLTLELLKSIKQDLSVLVIRKIETTKEPVEIASNLEKKINDMSDSIKNIERSLDELCISLGADYEILRYRNSEVEGERVVDDFEIINNVNNLFADL